MITNETCVALSLRPSYGKFLRYRICIDSMTVEFLDTTEFLKFKEKHAGKPALCLQRLDRRMPVREHGICAIKCSLIHCT